MTSASIAGLTFEYSPVAKLLTDSTGKIHMVNQEICRLFGYTSEELIAQPVEILVPARYRNRHPEERRKYMDAPTKRRMGAGRNLYGVCKGGREIPIEIGLTPISAEGQTYFMSAIVDISERVKRERELSRSNEELEQYAYAVSHDLQAPLRHIRSFVELLTQIDEIKSSSSALEYIQFVMDGSERMRAMTQDLLTFSKLNRVELNKVQVDLNQLVKQVIQIFEKNEDTDFEVDELPQVQGDDTLLGQVFQNLIQNSLKFRAPERKLAIKIRTKNKISAHEILVEDNGIGFDPEHSERIFRIFQQLHHQEEYPGTGIGLSICKKIIELHGGQISVQSQPQVGTQFSIIIPE